MQPVPRVAPAPNRQARRHAALAPAAGVTLIEVAVGVTIIALIAAMSLPHLRAAYDRTHAVSCEVYRDRVEKAERVFVAKHDRHSVHVSELCSTGILDREHICGGGGLYAWWPFAEEDARYQTRYGCSRHAPGGLSEPIPPPVTTPPRLDDTFDRLGDGWRAIAGPAPTIDAGRLTLGPKAATVLGGDPAWEDLDLDTSASLSGNGTFQLLFRASADEQGRISGYALELSPTTDAKNGGSILLRKIVDGKSQSPFAKATVGKGFDWKGVEHSIRVSAVGSAFAVSFHGKQVLEGKDATFGSGRIGFAVPNGSTARVDRLTVQ